ncbi:MAG: photoactive yellow protein [Roseivirga sp.]|jgi:photoactive yellow protein
MLITFYVPELFQLLEDFDNQDFDNFNFGIIKMNKQGDIQAYNKYEADLAANDQQQVLGKNFFTQIAPCTNNFLVAEKYSNLTEELDETLDYIFTYRMRPTAVTLRLLSNSISTNQYLIVRLKS